MQSSAAGAVWVGSSGVEWVRMGVNGLGSGHLKWYFCRFGLIITIVEENVIPKSTAQTTVENV